MLYKSYFEEQSDPVSFKQLSFKTECLFNSVFTCCIAVSKVFSVRRTLARLLEPRHLFKCVPYLSIALLNCSCHHYEIPFCVLFIYAQNQFFEHFLSYAVVLKITIPSASKKLGR